MQASCRRFGLAVSQRGVDGLGGSDSQNAKEKEKRTNENEKLRKERWVKLLLNTIGVLTEQYKKHTPPIGT